MHDRVSDMVTDYFTVERNQERMAKKVDVDQLILECEQEIAKLIYCETASK